MQLLFKPYTFHAAGIRSNSDAGTPHKGGDYTLLHFFRYTSFHIFWHISS